MILTTAMLSLFHSGKEPALPPAKVIDLTLGEAATGSEFLIVDSPESVAEALFAGSSAVGARSGIVSQDTVDELTLYLSSKRLYDFLVWSESPDFVHENLKSAKNRGLLSAGASEEISAEFDFGFSVMRHIDLEARKQGLVVADLPRDVYGIRFEDQVGSSRGDISPMKGFHLDVLNREKQYFPVRGVRTFVGMVTELLRQSDVLINRQGKATIAKDAQPVGFPSDCWGFLRGVRSSELDGGAWHRQPRFKGARLFGAINFPV